MKQSVKIVFMGTPEFAVESLETLIQQDYDVRAVVTVPDKPSGRGRKIHVSPVKEAALKHNIPILQPIKLIDPNFIKELEYYKADIFVVVAFRILPEVVWSMPKLGTFNLHASLLPQYRGAAPINWAIINGDKETGVSTFLLDKKIDTGKLIFQKKCSIESDDNFGSLYEKLKKLGAPVVLETIEVLVNHKVSPQTQKEEKILKPAPKILTKTKQINWKQEAPKVHNLVRGLSPYPTAHTVFNMDGEKLDVKIAKTAIVEDHQDNENIGKIISDGKKYLRVYCRQGIIDILEIQIPGKKNMPIKSFLAGFRGNLNSLSFE
ncbi:MAG: methionyl-tRNA formyltransferase [Bacteroidales bacterium]